MMSLPDFIEITGVELATACAGIKQRDRDDVLLIALAEGSSVAAVFTQNKCYAAPVALAKQHLAGYHTPRYLLVNAGNANAGTGEQGMIAARECIQSLSVINGVESEAILPFSTGVIGEPLPVAKIQAVFPELVSSLAPSNWSKAAHAILTTDTQAKGVTQTVQTTQGMANISAIAKGSGMIKPNMATMLAFIATDLVIDQASLQSILSSIVDDSFNAITVDSDTSTNDAAVLMATGKGSVNFGSLSTQEQALVVSALRDVCIALAQRIVQDGEGATKFITIQVTGGVTKEDCRAVAFTVAESPLVKTAMFASDPNWGRILAAIGRAPIENIDPELLSIAINQVPIVDGGSRSNAYDEATASKALASDVIDIDIHLNQGEAQATVWSCDFSYDYIKINAEYRS